MFDRFIACAVPVEGIMTSRSTVVLVVEDNPLILMCALDLVEAAGFEGIGAANADEAIVLLEARDDIHLVFTDVEMPGAIDGLKLAHYIRDRWPPIHLIVASGRTILEESQLPAGSRFFAKPYDNDTIVREMTRMLATLDAGGSGEKT